MNYKRLSSILIGLIISNAPLYCRFEEKGDECDCLKQRPLIEAKAGYFFFTDSTMNDIYNQEGIDLQLSGSYPVYRSLHIYGSIEYLEKAGYSKGFNQKTSLWEVPLSLGLRAVILIKNYASYYLTIGPRYFSVYTHNYSVYVPHQIQSSGCGGFINTGFLFILPGNLTIDFFGEYSYAKLSFHSSKPGTQGRKAQVGGLTFGGGLGYSF